MFPNTPHCELAVLFERVEAVVPEKVDEPMTVPEPIENTSAAAESDDFAV